jgi:hypothetical protein
MTNFANNDRAYRAITNTTLVVLIVAGYVSDRLGTFRWLAALFAVAAAITAITAYFARRWSSQDLHCETKDLQAVTRPSVPQSLVTDSAASRDVAQAFEIYTMTVPGAGAYEFSLTSMQHGRKFGETVATVIERLAGSEDEYEFTLTARGEFRIQRVVPAKRSRRSTTESGRVMAFSRTAYS